MAISKVLRVRSSFAHQHATRFDMLGFQSGANLSFVGIDARTGEITKQLAHDILVTRFLEIGLYDGLGVSFALCGRKAHAIGCPFTYEAVAPSLDAEQHIRIVGELGLFAALAVVENGHGVSTVLV
jgi:hypothetical protein